MSETSTYPAPKSITQQHPYGAEVADTGSAATCCAAAAQVVCCAADDKAGCCSAPVASGTCECQA